MYELQDTPAGPGRPWPTGTFDPTRDSLGALVTRYAEATPGGGHALRNLPLWRVLATHGFDVTGLAARVVWNRPAGVPIPRTHLLLRVELPDAPWVVDAELGARPLLAPLPAEGEGPATTTCGPFRLVPVGAEFELQARVDAEWRPLYRFGPEPLRLRDDTAALTELVEAHDG